MIYLTANEISMPILGLGTYKIKSFDLCYNVVENALKYGYRMFDTAQVYKNEEDLGKSFEIILPKLNLKREDIFIITKIATYNHADKCYESIKKSMENLRTKYIDMVLIHWPGVKGFKLDDKRNLEYRIKTYKELERAYTEGLIRSIGISNYNLKHLEELFTYCTIKPVLLQSEFHPLLIQNDLTNFCKKHGMIFQAYSSLGTSDAESTKKLVDNETIKNIAKKHGKTSAQILLKWAVQQNISVIPKSSQVSHLRDNIDIFDFNLDEQDVDLINKLDRNLHLCWNPDTVL
ncbi:unnamed protein product [Brachionus calyciflorus]|uniref:NADP-dependent oxidoreductase domain-containing protein n=1 Tax=Brachionus calyciflorus TaxID=104777 RepID=A0A813YGW6_9BILA|nr:unnamed protein product [Brachionus calyciflorus]